MRTRITIVCLMLLSLTSTYAALKNDGSRIEPGTHSDPVDIGIILRDGDWRMDLANDCLAETFAVDENSEMARTLRILKLTGFSLSTVVMKEVKQDPVRIRFGFEFTKPQDLKTVYWETDCAVDTTDESRLPEVASNATP